MVVIGRGADSVGGEGAVGSTTGGSGVEEINVGVIALVSSMY